MTRCAPERSVGRSVGRQPARWGETAGDVCMHPPQRQDLSLSGELRCHWITFILAVSKEASSCKSTHMNLPDSKEDGALPNQECLPLLK